MENFKSYASEQHAAPFPEELFAIVGPINSGKRNLIDDMLFVFGKCAKQMRLNKIVELIHNSSIHQNLNKAQVLIHF